MDPFRPIKKVLAAGRAGERRGVLEYWILNASLHYSSTPVSITFERGQ